MFAVGLATTLLPVVADNAVAGAHVYVTAPLANNAVDEPLHMVAPGVLSTGNGFTVTVNVVELMHLLITVTV